MSIKRYQFDLEPEQLEESLRDLGEKLQRTFQDHRYSRVRLSWKGKPLLPDIPLALFVAGEAASFWWAGPLRAVILNLGIGSVITVEVVNEADTKVEAGRALFMEGEVEQAEAAYRDALRMKPSSAGAHFNLGVLLRVTGKLELAREHLRQAAELDDGPDSEKAQELLEKMQ